MILCGCRSLTETFRRGDPGSASLPGAWLSSGARSVVASHLNVGKTASEEFSLEMLRAMENGRSVAEAARQARAKLWQDGGLRRLVQASYQVMGVSNQPVFDTPTHHGSTSRAMYVIIGAGVGLLFLAGFCAFRRGRN